MGTQSDSHSSLDNYSAAHSNSSLQKIMIAKLEFELDSCCSNTICNILTKQKESGMIDDFEVKTEDKKVCVSTCKLDQTQVTELLKEGAKHVKYLGDCGSHETAMKPCCH